ncbi:MAG TPA: Gfo/Idh/MocA family oxidoreductase [Aquabacterium sp.]|nr:Gfo/Idh/MocA family oxidoreductase [Aquabacterium sp.]
MSDTLDIGLIGLGVMGQRMLARLAAHPRLRAAVVWDADPAALARTLAAYPGCRAAGSAAAVIATPGLASLYIATPPGPHMALSDAAFDAGLAVLCEKPLTTDFDAARRCIARIDREGRRAAVNFSLASSPGLAALQAAWGDGNVARLGALQQVDIGLAFAAWPRPWQAAAGAWLAQRAEGGFSREVLSHFVFVLQRVLGPATVQRAQPVWPADGVGAETALTAQLVAGGVPVTVNGRVGADAPDDFNRMLWQGSAGAIALQDWFGLQQQSPGGSWQPQGDAAAMRAEGQAAQLEQWVALIEGRSHGLPGYAEALAVQQTIEALLAGA